MRHLRLVLPALAFVMAGTWAYQTSACERDKATSASASDHCTGAKSAGHDRLDELYGRRCEDHGRGGGIERRLLPRQEHGRGRQRLLQRARHGRRERQL